MFIYLKLEPVNEHNVRDSILGSSGSAKTEQAILAIVKMLDSEACESAMIILTELVSHREAAIVIFMSTAPKVLMKKLNARSRRAGDKAFTTTDRDPGLLPKCIASLIQEYLQFKARNDVDCPSETDLGLPALHRNGAWRLAVLLEMDGVRSIAADTMTALVQKDATNRQKLVDQQVPTLLSRLLRAAQKDLKAGPDTSLEGSLVTQIASITMALAEIDPKAFTQHLGDEKNPQGPLQQLTDIWQKQFRPREVTTPNDGAAVPGGSANIKPTSNLDPYGQQIDMVAAAVAVMLKKDDDFREAFDPSELVKLLSVRLGARFQSGTWNAIKELASHCPLDITRKPTSHAHDKLDQHDHRCWKAVESSEVVPVLTWLARHGNSQQTVFAEQCLEDLARLKIGPRSKNYSGNIFMNACRVLSSPVRDWSENDG
ncbi:hypothetical protein HWV62_39299 [Athelia sp. TMB]|nr:hypothetical protein HWV62_39299 [Athelia sp. TMB]